MEMGLRRGPPTLFPSTTPAPFLLTKTSGILAFGFARVHCGDYRQERHVAFSCIHPVWISYSFLAQRVRHLELPEHPPRLASARAPPQRELLCVDPPSLFDLEPASTSEHDPFDQSLPGDDGTWSA